MRTTLSVAEKANQQTARIKQLESTIAEQKRTIETLNCALDAKITICGDEKITELKRTILDMEARGKMLVDACLRAQSWMRERGMTDLDFDAAINSSPSSTSEWTARFVADWVRENWKPVTCVSVVDDIRLNPKLVHADYYMRNPELFTPLYAIPDKE